MALFNPGYSIEKEIVGVLLMQNTAISAEDIEEAGGGAVAVILKVQDKRRLNLRSMVRDLIRSSGKGIHVAAVALPQEDGETAWRVVSLDYLRGLADGMADMKRMLRLEASIRAHG